MCVYLHFLNCEQITYVYKQILHMTVIYNRPIKKTMVKTDMLVAFLKIKIFLLKIKCV